MGIRGDRGGQGVGGILLYFLDFNMSLRFLV